MGVFGLRRGTALGRAPARVRSRLALLSVLAVLTSVLAAAPGAAPVVALFNAQGTLGSNTASAASTFPLCYGDAVLADSPVGFWHLDETSGTTAADASGNTNAGTYAGGTALNQSGALPDIINNRAAGFDGIDDRVTMPSAPSLTVSSAITLEAWVYKADLTAVHPIIEYGDASTMGVHLWGYNTGTRLYVNFVDTSGGSHIVLSGEVFSAANTWYHVAATYDGAVGILYVNGTEAARATLGSVALRTATAVNLGYRPMGGDDFSGRLDEAAVYGTALSAARIRAHYTTGRCYKDEVLADTPTAYWRLGEASGSTAKEGLRGATGTYKNGPALGQSGALTGASDTAATFDGVDDHLTVPYDAAFNQSQFTVEGWARPTGGTGTYRGVAGSFLSTQKGYSIGVHSSNFWMVAAGNGTLYTQSQAPTTVVLNTWYHVVGTFDGTTIRLYVNGQLVDSDTPNPSYVLNPSAPFTVGMAAAGSNPFPGTIDEVAIYSSALSAGRIKAHYLNGRSYLDTVLDSSPVAHWRLGETSGTSAADSKGSYPGTYTNGPTLGKPGAIAADADGAATFDGVDDYVTVPYNAAINPASFTVEAWVKPTGGAGTKRAVVASWMQGSFGLGPGFLISATSGNAWGIQAGTGSSAASASSGSATLNSWTFLALTYSSNSVKLYVNGTLASSIGIAVSPNTSNPFTIGAALNSSNAAADFFPGQIDEVTVYSKALTAADIQMHYDSGRQ